MPSVKLKNKDIVFLYECLKCAVESRFDYVVNDKPKTHKLFLAPTFMEFRFKKFAFIKEDSKRKECIKKAKTFLRDIYKQRLKLNPIATSSTQGKNDVSSSASDTLVSTAPPALSNKVLNNKVSNV